MKKASVFLVLTVSVILINCKSGWRTTLEKIDKRLLYNNNTNGWELTQEINEEWSTSYRISKNDNDTLKILEYSIGNKGEEVYLLQYLKAFRCNQLDTCYLEMNSQDTLFFYRQNGKVKIFEVGEYAYRFSRLKLDSVELSFYLAHEDSLRRIKGNNLPRLAKLKK
jgi:hypothetical protein